MTPDKKVEPAPLVPPFVRYVASAIPMVFDDSLSYYECLAALTKYLQDVVTVINNNGEVTEEYIQLTKDMKEYMDNYFDNLDVQEEINNKLDQMAEDGTLQEIITTYIQANVAWTFDTVADMKTATNLVNGSFARTLGFRSINDGGGAIYKISNSGTANEMDVIAIDDLYATIVKDKIMSPEQFGAYGDSTHDDTDSINRCIAIADVINFYPKTYLVSIDPVNAYAFDLPSNKTINGNEGTLVLTPNALDVYQIIKINGKSNITIRDLNIIGDIDNHEGTGELCEGIKVISSEGINIDNCTISKTKGDNIRLSGYETPNDRVTIDKCKFLNGGRNGLSIEDATNTLVSNCYFGSFTARAPKAGIDVEPFDATQTIHNVVIDNCICENTVEGYIIALLSTTANDDVTLSNSQCLNSRLLVVNLGSGNNINVENVKCNRFSVAQNDTDSHVKATGLTIKSSEISGLGYRDSSIFMDLSNSGDVCSTTQTGIYNTIVEADIDGDGNYSPIWINGLNEYKLFTGSEIDIRVNGTFQVKTGITTASNRFDVFKQRESYFIPTEAMYDLNMNQTTFYDKNSVNGGVRYFDRVPQQVKLCVIANASEINPVIASNRPYSYVLLDGLENAKVPAGERRYYIRYGNSIFVSLT